MSKARKCDRCGQYYDKNENLLGPKDNHAVNGVALRFIRGHHQDFYPTDDLCDACALAYVEWFEAGKPCECPDEPEIPETEPEPTPENPTEWWPK